MPVFLKQTSNISVGFLSKIQRLINFASLGIIEIGFWSMARPGSQNLFYDKMWVKRYTLMWYRSKLAEVGGNWLKTEKYGFHHRKRVEKSARN